MFARMVLPLLGGSPSIWNTARAFYQAALPAGHAHAHVSSSRLGVQRRLWVPLPLLLLPLVALPLGVAEGQIPPTEINPIPWRLGLMCLRVGLPFCVVPTSSPLLQRCFASTAHPSARERWKPRPTDPRVGIWTDDFARPFRILSRNGSPKKQKPARARSRGSHFLTRFWPVDSFACEICHNLFGAVSTKNSPTVTQSAFAHV